MRLLPRASTPIGLDLGAHTIRAVQTDQSGGVVTSAAVTRPDPALPISVEEIEHFRGVLYRQGFIGRTVFAAVPKSALMRTTIELPPKDSGAPIAEIARSEIARQAKADPSSFEFALWDAPQPPRHGGSSRAIGVGCPHEDASALIASIESTNLTVAGLFTPSTALAASLPPPKPGATIAAVDIGWSDATFILIGHGSIVFERQLGGCGIGVFVAKLAKSRGLDPARLSAALRKSDGKQGDHPAVREITERMTEAVASELRSSVDYLRGCDGVEPPERIILAGGGAAVPGLPEAVSDAAGVRVRAHQDGPTNAAATGLARMPRACAIREAA